MFEFLFKYSPIVYREGIWAFRLWPAIYWTLLVLLLVLATAYLIYRKPISPVQPRLRFVLAFLKFAALVLIILCLAEPFISITSIVPKKSSVLILVDDSASMGIPDGDNRQKRRDAIAIWLGDDEQAGVSQALEENFNVLTYRFSETVAPLTAPDELTANGKATDLARALEFAEKQSHVYPLAAVIVVTDGVQTQPLVQRPGGGAGKGDPLQAAALLRNANVPVFAVGVGSEIENDLQLARVMANHSVTEDDIVELSAIIQARRKPVDRVTVQLLEEGRLVQSREVALEQKFTRVNFSTRPTRRGWLTYRVVVQPHKDEIIKTNNERSFIINNEPRSARILYVEELHPADYKFIRRALDLDKNLQLVSLIRTGPDKLYRQGISTPDELRDGFPSTAEQLFAYDALIIGSIEAAFFTQAQQDLIRDFVSIRGGGLMLLGGPKSFTAGGWERSRIADVLPVELLSKEQFASSESGARYAAYRLQLTPAGLRDPALQLSLEPQENRRLWESMPDLLNYHPLGKARPGASVLAVHPLGQAGRPRIIMAKQRYGRGRSMVLATSTSWRWQMQLHSSDMRHEKFWRQVSRWLAFSAPKPVELTLEKDEYFSGESVTIYATVADSGFAAVANAQISAQITLPPGTGRVSGRTFADADPPVGSIQTIDLQPDLAQPGHYKGTFIPQSPGLFEIEILAHSATGKYLGRSASAFLVGADNIEFQQPDLRAGLLQRLSEITGGQYLHLRDADDIADRLSVAPSTYAKTVERDLWDAPGIYFLIVLLLAVEWFTGRAKGMS